MLENEYMSPEKQTLKNQEMTSTNANIVFKNQLINIVNKNVSDKDQIELGKSIHFDWFVDEEFPEGRFGLMSSKLGSEPGLIDETIYNLDSKVVKEIFNELNPEMQKIIIADWEESLRENKRKQTEFNNALKRDLPKSEKKSIEDMLKVFEEGERKIEMKLEILK